MNNDTRKIYESRRFRGDRLRQAREQRGYSQEELSARIASAQAQITRYETESAQPSQAVLIRLASVLNVSTDWLLGLVDDPAGHITEADLSPIESRILDAYRRGDYKGLIDVLARGDE